MSDKAILEYGGERYEFPVIKGTEDELAIDIKTLRAATGMVTIDPGYKNTGSCESGRAHRRCRAASGAVAGGAQQYQETAVWLGASA